MALNLGENFKQRWLNTPEAVRHTFCDELSHICTLLEPDTTLNTWQQKEILLQHQHHKQIKHAYDSLKKQLLAEKARIAAEKKRQRQAELELKIAQNRAKEEAYLAQLQLEEIDYKYQQLEQLAQISQQLQQELKQLSASEQVHFDRRLQRQFNQETLNIDDIQLRLEIESEAMIEHTLQTLRRQLKQAAQEEISLMLEHFRSQLDVQKKPTLET